MRPASVRYTIRINGHLGATVLSAFPGLAAHLHDAETVLTGFLDQSALYGVLAEIEALGLELLEVRQLASQRESPESGDSCSSLTAPHPASHAPRGLSRLTPLACSAPACNRSYVTTGRPPPARSY
jgi:hypothetical protein